MKKVLFVLLGTLLVCTVQAQFTSSGGLKVVAETKPSPLTTADKAYIEETWKAFNPLAEDPAASVVENRERVAAYINANVKQDIEYARLYNNIEAVRKMLAYCSTQDLYTVRSIRGIAPVLLGMDLRSEEIRHYVPLMGAINDYFNLRYIMEELPFVNLPGSVKVTDHLAELRGIPDYKKFREVLELGNEPLTQEYMKSVESFFPFDGYTPPLRGLCTYIEKLMPESAQKKKIMDLCKLYENYRDGLPAADFDMPGHDDKRYTLKDFRGKVLVVDVWATWCSGCIERIPAFMKVAESYKGRDDIEFITISIDQPDAVNVWKKTVERLKLSGVKNLLPDKIQDLDSFKRKYNIVGIPRYFIIDKDGTNITLYAPSPKKDAFRELIEKTLNK